MPKGQDRYANRARKRTPRSGQTIRIGKTIGVAPLVGEYDDVRRWLKDLVTYGLSLRTLQRLGRWCVQMAEAEGFTPATDVLPEIQRLLDLQLHKQGILPADGESGFKPTECFRLEPESPIQRWEREAKEHEQRCLDFEEIEAAIALARKYGELDLVAVLEQHYDAEAAERIKRERHEFTLRYLDVLGANANQRFLYADQRERERMAFRYGPQTVEETERIRKLDAEYPRRGSSKREDREAGRLVGTAMESQGWDAYGIYSTFRKTIQDRGHQLAEDE